MPFTNPSEILAKFWAKSQGKNQQRQNEKAYERMGLYPQTPLTIHYDKRAICETSQPEWSEPLRLATVDTSGRILANFAPKCQGVFKNLWNFRKIWGNSRILREFLKKFTERNAKNRAFEKTPLADIPQLRTPPTKWHITILARYARLKATSPRCLLCKKDPAGYTPRHAAQRIFNAPR